MVALRIIINIIDHKHNEVFFINGPGGTYKTFLYQTLMESLRSRCQIVLPIASSSVVATLLPSRMITHY